MAKKIEKAGMTLTDAKGKVLRQPRDNAAESCKFAWWKDTENDQDLAQNILGTVKFLKGHQGARNEQLTVSTRLYGKTSAYNLIGTAFTRAASVNSNPMSDRVSFNVIQSVIDTLVAKIAKNKVIPSFVTNGGVWQMQRKAEKLCKFVDGIFYEVKAHTKIVLSFWHASIWGDGLLHIFKDNGRVGVEHVFPHEILVDMVETLSAPPRQLHRERIADREVLMDLFPDKAEEIAQVAPASYPELGGSGTVADLLTVVESWRLPTQKGEKDGYHAIIVGDVVLEKGVYEKDYFPFAKIPYARRPLGYWGQGAAERLQTLQGEINRLMITIQKNLWMGSGFKIFSHVTDKIPTQYFNNDVAPIIKWAGEHAPMYVAPQLVQPEIYQQVDALIDKAYRQEGVSQMAAASMKPQGLNSGKALREMDNIEADRFLFVQQDVEEFTLEVARQCIEVAKDIYKEKKKYEVCFPSNTFLQTIDWKDINLEADEYVLKAYPTSSLPEDPSGRLETVTEFMQAGLVSPRAGRKLLTMPDIEMSDSLANAKEDLLHKTFEAMLDEGEKAYRAPEPEWDLQLAGSMVLDYIAYAELHNCPPENIALLRRFNEQLGDLVGATQPPMPMAGAPGAPPMANPMPTPTSQMLPNVNTPPIGAA